MRQLRGGGEDRKTHKKPELARNYYYRKGSVSKLQKKKKRQLFKNNPNLYKLIVYSVFQILNLSSTEKRDTVSKGMFSFTLIESPLFVLKKSAAHSAGLLFANEVCHEIKLVLSQPQLRKLLDAVQTHFYD